MQIIKDVLARNIEEKIAPVIYFHQVDPITAEQEVREYVFTTRPMTQVHQVGGIHEQMVGLLTEIYAAIEKGHKLPACWISGFFGSGKSSFAKLLGLALDGMTLPSGTTMDKALIARDDTPNAEELRAAFIRLQTTIKSKSVIFDIGTAAKNNESIPHTVYREILKKLGYSEHDGISHFEIALEDDDRYEEFLESYKALYNKDWHVQCNSGLAPQKFRAVYKQLFPEQDDLMETSTFDIHSLPINKLVSTLVRVMERRSPGYTFFIVVDEVSQYINKDHNKMLDLQSFVSEIGGRVKPGKSPLWLLVTGQEKLEEESRDSVLFKLQDRFPEALRIHLDRANVREVVGRRLLKKKAGSALESYLNDAHLDSLRLHAFDCATVKRAEVIENYPLLPAHIPLFMDITQCIRNTSTRTQSDAGGVRSVINNIWDLFNRDPVRLKDRELGTLMTLDMLYDIIGSSVDTDVQLTLHKIFEKHSADSWESKVVKSIALLEMNGEQRPVQPKLIAELLYPNLGSSPVLSQVEKALANLNTENWIQFHEKTGWTIQNNAAQDWNRQKTEISIASSEIDATLQELQIKIVENISQPEYLGTKFPLVSYWGSDTRINGKNEFTQVAICFHWITNASRREKQDDWLAKSREDATRFHWVSADTSNVEAMVREYCRSQKMVARYRSQGNLQQLQNQLLFREQSESERLFESIKRELRQIWLDGKFYFNGAVSQPRLAASTFEQAVKTEVQSRIAALYHKYEQGNIKIVDNDFKQLLEKDSAGLSSNFMDKPGCLGIATNDGGKILFQASGVIPVEILQVIKEKNFISGEKLISIFAAAPYGYSRLVIKSAVLGLLRAEKIQMVGENSSEISSIQDPGARNTFESDREFNKADIEPKPEIDGITDRDRTAIRQFFEKTLHLSNVDNTSDMLADLTFKHFVNIKDQVTTTQRKLESLGLQLPLELVDFNKTLTECTSDRHVDKALRRVKATLPILSDGYPRLCEVNEALTDTTEKALRSLRSIVIDYANQLAEIGQLNAVSAQLAEVKNHLEGSSPWRAYADVGPAADAVKLHYQTVRSGLLEEQKEVLESAIADIKLRDEFANLDQDQQFEVLEAIRRQSHHTSLESLQPSLLVLDQVPSRITEASARAQKTIDDFMNEKGESGKDTPIRIHTVRLDLKNKVISNEAELDAQLKRLREKCMAQLQLGAKVRFEE